MKWESGIKDEALEGNTDAGQPYVANANEGERALCRVLILKHLGTRQRALEGDKKL